MLNDDANVRIRNNGWLKLYNDDLKSLSSDRWWSMLVFTQNTQTTTMLLR